MKMRHRVPLLSALAGIAVLVLSCCVPMPSRTLVAGSVKGTVVDARTNSPVAAAEIVATRAGHSKLARSDASGTFVLAPIYQWHGLVYLGSPGIAPTPWYYREPRSPMLISISAPGYESSKLTIPSESGLPYPLKVPVPLQIQLRKKAD